MQANLPTPKALHNTAQGRAAHPGTTTDAPRAGTLKGFYKALWTARHVKPFQGFVGLFGRVNPGCAARPWAVLSNPFGVKNSRTSRTGVTVLEVLIAIGVASVGLLGVILLIPLADHQMNRGLVLERANQVGANAFREIEARQINDPSRWIGFVDNVGAANDGSAVTFTLPPGLMAANGQYRRAFCIDPLFVANNFNFQANSLILGPNNKRPQVFPFVAPDLDANGNDIILRMPRLSLPVSPSTASVMGTLQADAVFISHDDLVFHRPETDRTLPPLQLDSSGTDNNNPRAWRIPDSNDPGWPHPNQRTRQASGRLSWLATIVPHEKAGAHGDDYLLSIVVFHNRDPSYAMDLTGEPDNERLVQIPVLANNGFNGFVSGGIGGGEVALMPWNSGLNASQAEDSLALRAGDWVLLSRRITYPFRNPTTGALVSVNNQPVMIEAPRLHRWYRVAAADPGLFDSDSLTNPPTPPPNSWIRFVTLEGPDWPADATTQVVIIKDVVAVFEKTIRLETSSLWTN